MAKEVHPDAVFQEERIHLENTEREIQALLNACEAKARSGEAEFSGAKFKDKDDILALQSTRQSINKNTARASFYKKALEQPYFGRIDVREDADDADTETYYVGNELINNKDEDVLVISWKDPMGSIFYANAQTNINVNELTFQLLLRRTLEIQHGKLLNYKTEYDAENAETLNGDIVDSFLLTVLKDKRRQKQLTNIIRTIQANQNRIIRMPQSNNLVVQGCAGSGKTMILLHRLSVLAYNNRAWDLSAVKIITPNRAFNVHINALSEELGLNSIERYSVEEYYISLMRQFNRTVDTGTEVHSEVLLDPAFLEEVYSLDFMHKIRADYDEYWDSVTNELQDRNFLTLCEKFGIESVKFSVHKANTVELLKSTIQRLQEKSEQQGRNVEDLSSRIEDIKARIDGKRYATSSLQELVEKRRRTADQAIDKAVQELSAEIEKQKKVAVASEKATTLRSRIESARNDKERVRRLQERIRNNASQYIDYEKIHSMTPDNFAKRVFTVNANIETSLQAKADALKRVPFYNFAKRNALKAEIEQLKADFAANAQAYLTRYDNACTYEMKQADEHLADLEKELAEEMQRVGGNKKVVADLEQRKTVLLSQRDALAQPDYTAWHNAVGSKFELAAVKDYDAALSKYDSEQKGIATLQELLTERQNELQQLNTQSLNEAQRQNIASYSDLAKQLEWQSILNNVLNKDLAALHIKHNVSRRVTNYRFKLYLRLLCSALYYRPLAKPDNFLCIDEAQDISIAEYHLLRAILGPRCVFNLYGDCNQKIYSYKGITGWEDIYDVTGIHDIMSEEDLALNDNKHVCLLNENYRNTLQITEFCNKEFDSCVTAVGIAGNPVEEKPLAEAVQWLWSLKHHNPELRVAVVYKPGSKEFRAQMDALPQTTAACWDIVDTDKLCILPVELVKGLEFDAVVAVVDRMGSNEKYVTFTRALDDLCVVRDSFRVDDSEPENPPEESPAEVDDQPTVPNEDAPTEDSAAEQEQPAEPAEEQPEEPAEKQPIEPAEEQPAEPINENAETEAFYAWLSTQISEEQGKQMREMFELVDDFCHKTSLLKIPVTALRNPIQIQLVKTRVRSSRAFLTANRMRMPLIFKALEYLATYSKQAEKLPAATQPVPQATPAQVENVQPEEPQTATVQPEVSSEVQPEEVQKEAPVQLEFDMKDQPEEAQPEVPQDTPAPSTPAVEPQNLPHRNDLSQYFPQSQLSLLVSAMAADGITTKEGFADSMVIGYINNCGYPLRQRTAIWNAVKPVWQAWREGKSGDAELSAVTPLLSGVATARASSIMPPPTSKSETTPVNLMGVSNKMEIATPENCLGRKPCAVKALGKTYPADSWRIVLVSTFNRFMEMHPDVMNRYADKPLTLQSKEPLFGKSVTGYSIDNGYRLNVIQSARDVLRIGKTLCALCEEPLDAVTVYLLPEDGTPTPALQAEARPAPVKPVAPAPAPEPDLSEGIKATITTYLQKQDLRGASLADLSSRFPASRDTIRRYLDSNPDFIEITRDNYLIREAIFDLDDVVDPLERILQKQFRRFYGFTTDKKLKEAADQELGMFINDYNFRTKEEIYGIAKYLFSKCKVNGIEHGFNNGGYIWEKPTDMDSNRCSILINLARRYESPILPREEISTQFELLGFLVTMYKQAMDLGPNSPFLQYDADQFVLAERLHMDAAWAGQIGDALDHLMASVQSDYMVLRAIREDWYAANLPVLPEGVHWTPLLLQEVVEHYLKGRYRTVHQYSGLSTETLCAAIVQDRSDIVSFADLVYHFVAHANLGKVDFTSEEFRQILVQAGMLQGAELRSTLSKALDDHRFAWDTAKENLHIVGV